MDGIEPDSTSYLMVIRAWANSNRPNRGSTSNVVAIKAVE